MVIVSSKLKILVGCSTIYVVEENVLEFFTNSSNWFKKCGFFKRAISDFNFQFIGKIVMVLPVFSF